MITPISFDKIPTLKELQAGFPGTRSLLFDMDGTLFDTEKYHAKAMMMIGEKFQIRPPHSPDVIHQLIVGKADHLVFDIIKVWEGFPSEWKVQDFVDAKNQNLITILRQIDPSEYFLPAIKDLLLAAREEDLFMGLVTSSEKIVTQELLQLTNLTQSFKLILTRDDCPVHKPDPWPYQKAMSESKIAKEQTIIFEDSQVGLEAAIHSGAHVVKVEWY